MAFADLISCTWRLVEIVGLLHLDGAHKGKDEIERLRSPLASLIFCIGSDE
jgi:hypothetical protein